MQSQKPTEQNTKRLGPPPASLLRVNTDFTRKNQQRRGASKGEIAVALGITLGFVFLGILFNLIKP